MFHRLLVICRGNICRSPVAAAMLRQRLSYCQVGSAGLSAVIDHDVDARARELAEAAGIALPPHRARQLEATLLEEADLVLVMSHDQRSEIAARWPQAMGKVMRLGHWLEQGRGADIPDPYRRSPDIFRQVHHLLDLATQEWARRL